MSRKDNLRDPKRRAAILAKRARGFETIPSMIIKGGVVIGVAKTYMERLKARLSKSKYAPHFGKKQQAKLAKQLAAQTKPFGYGRGTFGGGSFGTA